MGILVGTAFLTGIIGKVAHKIWSRKTTAVEKECRKLDAVKKPDHHSQPERKT